MTQRIHSNACDEVCVGLFVCRVFTRWERDKQSMCGCNSDGGSLLLLLLIMLYVQHIVLCCTHPCCCGMRKTAAFPCSLSGYAPRPYPAHKQSLPCTQTTHSSHSPLTPSNNAPAARSRYSLPLMSYSLLPSPRTNTTSAGRPYVCSTYCASSATTLAAASAAAGDEGAGGALVAAACADTRTVRLLRQTDAGRCWRLPAVVLLLQEVVLCADSIVCA